MKTLSDLELPLTEVEKQLLNWAEEALDLRFGEASDKEGELEMPNFDAGPAEIMALMLRVRKRMDRVEGLRIKARRAKGRASRATAVAKSEASDAWDESISAVRNNSVRRGLEYEGPRERYALSNLAVLDQQRLAREAERLLSVADEAYDVIDMCYRGLENFRQELMSMMKAFQFQNYLQG